MPNGGYPMHFMTRVEGSDLALSLKGSDMTLVRLIEPSQDDPLRLRIKSEMVGRLTPNQIRGLLFHLQYWGGGSEDGAHGTPRGTFAGQRIEPQFDAANCVYDY